MAAGRQSHAVTVRGDTQDLKVPVWMLEPACASAAIASAPTLDVSTLRAILSLSETCRALITQPGSDGVLREMEAGTPRDSLGGNSAVDPERRTGCADRGESGRASRDADAAERGDPRRPSGASHARARRRGAAR
jgi:hypothetical protein